MFKKLALSSLITVAALSASVGHAFGLSVPKLPIGGASSGGAGAADVDTFLKQGAESNELFTRARTQLAYALASKEDKDKLAEANKQAKTALAAKDAKATDAQKNLDDEAASILKNTSEADAQANLKNLDAAQKSNATKSLGNMALAILQQKEQLTTGQNLLKSASGNMALVSKLPAMKDSVSIMTSNLAAGGDYMTRLPGLFKSAGIMPVLPTDTSSKPQEVSDSDF